MPYLLEVTDTFSGESNYAWVKRETVPSHLSRRQLVLHLKRLMGITGERASTTDFGDMIEVRPKGRHAPCIIGFVWRVSFGPTC